mmetsp:Transcript_33728/g.87196  ORF Transcript_33728/g.87196 Transcript_33728/m.87196 type:complete len:205 (+) Transcript_33728:3-617(+)
MRLSLAWRSPTSLWTRLLSFSSLSLNSTICSRSTATSASFPKEAVVAPSTGTESASKVSPSAEAAALPQPISAFTAAPMRPAARRSGGEASSSSSAGATWGDEGSSCAGGTAPAPLAINTSAAFLFISSPPCFSESLGELLPPRGEVLSEFLPPRGERGDVTEMPTPDRLLRSRSAASSSLSRVCLHRDSMARAGHTSGQPATG